MHADAPLSHGQLYSWREVDSYPEGWKKEANLPATWDLRGRSLDDVTAALRRLVRRHEPLRTTYHLVDGVPVQRVHEDVALPVERVDRVITDFGDPDRTTGALVGIPFPMTDALCWRGELVTTDGVPMFLSLSFSHLILDVWSIIELGSQFDALVRDPSTAPPTAPSPRELAHRHAEDAASGRRSAAERYWSKLLEDDHRSPALPTLPPHETKPRVQATLHSVALGGLSATAASALGVSAPAVVMALVAAGLAEHAGARRVTLNLMSSNRFTPDHRHAVGTLNQLIPVVVDVDAGLPLGEHITRTHWAAAKAYRYSSYDVDRIAAIAAEAGATGDHDGWFNQLFPCWFNYLQLDGEPCAPASLAPAELVWTPDARQYGQPFDVRVTVKGGRMSVALRTDPDVVTADGVTSILRAVALGVRRAVIEPETATKDLWDADGAELPPALFPPRPPAPPRGV
ncbi:condensation domain-containing protein [Saccharothrix sp. NRRL B-16314]|uniref:condensation domain-containing protein n=1 Tax=Saccharothrix sp. NRRL B-16314 TaxID=1463825 RepID=UPI0005253A00|nr:condensation domain-containing protein [Saccharothrix sp. NRRL B-16314]